MKNEKKVIFILGAGVMQIPALQTAKRMGWEVIAADGNEQAEGRKYADRFEHVDLKDREAMLETVRQCRREQGVDGVFTAGTDFSATVAWVAEQCGLPGIRYETALNATDKVRMRQVFQEHGVPQPDFVAVTNEEEARLALQRLAFPLVVKPVDNMGARGVRRVDSVTELMESYATAVSYSRTQRVIIEEYIEGSEFSLDALIDRGVPVLCGIADRHICFEPFFVEMGHTMPTDRDLKTQGEIASVFFKGIAALGIDSGAAKGDIKLSSRGPLVGEIAARLSGGYMSGWTYPYASGVAVTESALRIAVGLPAFDLRPKEKAFSAERAFISIPGTIGNIGGIEQARQAEGVKDLFVRVQEGTEVDFPKNNIEKSGNVITKGASREQAIQYAQEAIAKIFLRLVPADDRTTAFLFKGAYPHVCVVAVERPENREALRQMPAWFGDPEGFDPARTFIHALPLLQEEKGTDWHGLSLEFIAARAVSLTGATLVNEPGIHGFVLGSLFWKALLKGSAQGAVYLLDTLKQKCGNRKELLRFLEETGK